MGFVYGELMQAKDDIKIAMNNLPRNYENIMGIIEAKMKNRLDTPIHLMAYLLNPYFHYKDNDLQKDVLVNDGMADFFETYFFGDVEMQNKVYSEEIPKYKKKDGKFGRFIAIKGCEVNDEKFDPGK